MDRFRPRSEPNRVRVRVRVTSWIVLDQGVHPPAMYVLQQPRDLLWVRVKIRVRVRVRVRVRRVHPSASYVYVLQLLRTLFGLCFLLDA